MAYNCARAAGTLASASHAKATTTTIRTQFIAVPGRTARAGRRPALHLPVRWPWEDAWTALHAASRPPGITAT